MDQSELITRFKNQDKNRRTKTCDFTTSNIFCEGRLLYSYGRHFTLAKYLKDDFFLINGDKYSSTTSRHQGEVNNILKGVTISATAIQNIISFNNIEYNHIIDFREDSADYSLFYNKKTKKYFKREFDYDNSTYKFLPYFKPSQGMFIPYNDKNQKNSLFESTNFPDQIIGKKEDFKVGYWHILGGVLFKIDKKYYVSALDENSYFVTELYPKFKKEKNKTFNLAIESLKPDTIKQAESLNQEVLRQGEYFFVNTSMTDYNLASVNNLKITQFKKLAKQKNLPNRKNRTNNHKAILFHENLKDNLKFFPKIESLQLKYDGLKIKYTDIWAKNILKAFGIVPKKQHVYKNVSDINLYYDIDNYDNLKDNLDTKYIMEFLRKENYSSFIKEEHNLRNKIDKLKLKAKSVNLKNLFAKGMVSHSAQEHRPLRLKKDIWYQVYKNTEVQSWSFTGQFD